MKIIRILKSLIKSYLSLNVATLAAFGVAFFCVIFEAIMLYSFGINYVSTMNSTEHDDCYYSLSFKEPVSIKSMEDRIQTIEKICKLRAYESRVDLDSDDTKCAVYVLGGEETSALNRFTQAGRFYFNADEKSGIKDAAIVASNLGLDVGEVVDFGKYGEIQIVGVFRFMANVCYVPISLAEKGAFDVTDIQFVTEKRLSYFQMVRLEKEIGEMDDVTSFFGGHTLESDRKQFVTDLTEFSVLLCVFLLGLLFLTQYMSKKNVHTYTLLGVLGASKGDIGFYFLLERILVVFAASVPAVLLHLLIGEKILNLVAGIANNMKIWDYGIVMLLTLLCTFLMSLPYLLLFVKRSFSYCFKRSE